VFLHLPLYSIVQFNLYNEYEGDMTDFVKEDKILQQQITEMNFLVMRTSHSFVNCIHLSGEYHPCKAKSHTCVW
jgi:hypothetical protein